MLKLYHSAYSTCSQKVRLCLAEKRLEWESHEVDLAGGEQLGQAYLAINPNGVVPTLVEDDRAIIDSSVICEFLDERYPIPPLSPSDLVDKAHMRSWLRFIEEIPTPAIRIPSLGGAISKMVAGLSDAERHDFIEARPIRKFIFRKLGSSGFSDEEVTEAMDKLALTLNRMDQSLTESKWLAGHHYTLADICMTPLIQRLEDLDLAHLWEGLPRVGDWLTRIQERESFGKAYYPGSHFTRDGVVMERPALARA